MPTPENGPSVDQARRAIEDALRALDDDLLGEAWTALENAQRSLIEADDAS
jgi:hypothetical protein